MSETNKERLPKLLAEKFTHEANLRDINGAFRDQVRVMRERPDPATGKSVADMVALEKKAIAALDRAIMEAWQFPNQVNMGI